ncbi:MAG TPA: agmatine deiminase family protein [bacterium]|jgi:agmatine/peptidylarginine deiminase
MLRICYRFVFLAIGIAMTLSFGLALADEAVKPPIPPWHDDPNYMLPIGPNDWEKANEHLFPVVYLTDDPPPAPVSNPGEWEPMSGVLIRYPFGLPMSLIAEMSQDVELKTIVSSVSTMNSVINQYQSGGVNLANCTFLIAPSNSIWTRDYGPWYIFTGNNEQGITDHNYNRPTRPDDNLIPWVLGDSLNIPVYGMPLTHTGGNYMSDGMGIAMSTNLVYSENSGLTPAQVDNYIYQYTGNDYIVMPDILTGGIHHIDCWAKMLDPGRIIVKRLSPVNTQLEANVALFQSTVSSYGKPYEVIRVDCQSSTPYTNGLFLDSKYFVPLFNNSLDAAAMATYQQALPGYEVLGWTGSWVSDDAIHCRAMGITDRYMLRIVHRPLFDAVNAGQSYTVGAKIHRYSNRPFINGTPVINWKTRSGSWNTIPMTMVATDSFTAVIPPQSNNTMVFYYIHAEDDSGRSEYHPYIGAPGAHRFNVLAPGGEDIALTPVNPPIIIPANGGSFSYNIEIHDFSTLPLKFWVWNMIRMPSGSLTGPALGPVLLNMNPGGAIVRQRSQNIPGTYPAGSYQYIGYVGTYPSAPLDSSSFAFSKSAAGDGGPWIYGLSGSGDAFEGYAADLLLPQAFTMQQNYPNPFNAQTTIRYELPYISHVQLAVYDVQGRLMADLVDGVRSAGVQELTFDASHLPSGMYFYRLQANGHSEAKKMILVK